MPLLFSPERSIAPRTTLTSAEAAHIRSLSILRGVMNGDSLRNLMLRHGVHVAPLLEDTDRRDYNRIVEVLAKQ